MTKPLNFSTTLSPVLTPDLATELEMLTRGLSTSTKALPRELPKTPVTFKHYLTVERFIGERMVLNDVWLTLEEIHKLYLIFWERESKYTQDQITFERSQKTFSTLLRKCSKNHDLNVHYSYRPQSSVFGLDFKKI